MVTALYWARDYCPGVQHVLKVDSDTFINMMLLTALLSALPSMAQTAPGHRWMLGHVNPKPVNVSASRLVLVASVIEVDAAGNG